MNWILGGRERAMLAIGALFVALDSLLTMVSVGSGVAQEANPVLNHLAERSSLGFVLLVRVPVVVFLLWLLLILKPKTYKYILMVLFAVVCYHLAFI